jgi:hypothetical protein
MLTSEQKLTQEKHRPSWTSITRIPEGAETILFKEKVRRWRGGMRWTMHDAGEIARWGRLIRLQFSNFPGMLPINVQRSVAKGRIASTFSLRSLSVFLGGTPRLC